MSASTSARRFVVIGGTGGIGMAIVRTLLQGGARVLATGRSEERLAALEDEGATTLRLDLTDPASASRELEGMITAQFGDMLDGIVFASGGYGPIGPTRTVDIGGLQTALIESLLSPLALLQAVAQHLDNAHAPSVVFLSGGGATDVSPNYSPYVLSKVGTVRLAENLAAEERGWKVNSVAPGFVNTAMHEATREAGPAASGGFLARTEAMMERAVSPQVAADLIAFLLSDASAGISGRLISAVWDPWRDEAGLAVLRDDEYFGRLRRIDDQFFFAREARS